MVGGKGAGGGGGVKENLHTVLRKENKSNVPSTEKKYNFAEFGGKTGSISVGVFATLVTCFVCYAASQWNWAGLFL